MKQSSILCDSAHERRQGEKLFGNLDLSDSVYLNLKRKQNQRVKMLDTLLNRAKSIATKYLCLIDTDDEGRIGEMLSDDLTHLTEKENMSYPQANSIIDITSLVLYKMCEDIHDLRNINGLAQQWQNG